MNYLLQAKQLKKIYHLPRKKLFTKRASVCPVNDVSITIEKNKNLGIAGESGSGKTTVSRLIGGLEEVDSGAIFFEGEPIDSASKQQKQTFRRSIQYIFQELYEALNPKRTVAQTLSEPLKIHRLHDQDWRQQKVLDILSEVGLSIEVRNKFPHELSGGQRQRVAIARSLMLGPKLIIADEPISALDVSVRAQILNLLVELEKKLGITYIVISHDLSVLKYLCDQIIVYYGGEIVEYHKEAENFFKNRGWHPYSEKLIEASFCDDVKDDLENEITQTNLLDPDLTGCRYYQLCPKRSERCKSETPKLIPHNQGFVACHYPK